MNPPPFKYALALFGQILRIYIWRPFSVRYSTHRSETLFGQILLIIIFGGLFQSASTLRSEALFGQILRINIWRHFSVRFNAYIDQKPFLVKFYA